MELTNQQNTLAIYSDLNSQMGALTQLGDAIASSGLCGCTKKEQGTLIAFTCIAEQMTPIQFNRKYDIIEGKLSQKSASMLAEFRSKYGGDFHWIATGDDGKKATLNLIYRGRETSIDFTIEEAQKRGLAGKKNYRETPGEMLRSRAITKGLRMVCPEIAAGVYSPEEIADFVSLKSPEVTQDGSCFGIVSKLESLLESRENQANDLAIKRGWIKDGQTFRDIEPERAKKIIANPAPMLALLDEMAMTIEAEIICEEVK